MPEEEEKVMKQLVEYNSRFASEHEGEEKSPDRYVITARGKYSEKRLENFVILLVLIFFSLRSCTKSKSRC